MGWRFSKFGKRHPRYTLTNLASLLSFLTRDLHPQMIRERVKTDTWAYEDEGDQKSRQDIDMSD